MSRYIKPIGPKPLAQRRRVCSSTTFSARLSLFFMNVQKRNTAACLLAISGAGCVTSSANLLWFGVDGLSTVALEARLNTEVFVIGAQLWASHWRISMWGLIDAGKSSSRSLGEAAYVGISRWSSGSKFGGICSGGHGWIADIGNGGRCWNACSGETTSESRRVDPEWVRHVVVHLEIKLRADCIGVHDKGWLSEARAR